jgi:hypothetical protein
MTRVLGFSLVFLSFFLVFSLLLFLFFLFALEESFSVGLYATCITANNAVGSVSFVLLKLKNLCPFFPFSSFENIPAWFDFFFSFIFFF